MGGFVATRVHEQLEAIPSLGLGFLDVHSTVIGARYSEKTLRFHAQARGEYNLHSDAGFNHMQTFAVEAGAYVTLPTKG
jgi:hypothetical protein